MSNSIFMLSKYLKKTVTTALILGLMLSPGLSAAQGISSSINIAAQAAELETEAEETQAEETQATATQATTDDWSAHANTSWYDANPDAPSYELTSAEQLAGLAYLVNIDGIDFAGKKVILTSDIDLGAYEWVPIGLDGDNPFRGSFDGSNKTISNMHISNEDPTYRFVGLFGYVQSGRNKTVTIENVKITSGSIDTNSDLVGGICGYAYGNITIKNCSNSASINCYGGQDVGGICGQAYYNVTITNCSNSGQISGSGILVGGICGRVNYSVTITNCSNSSQVSGNNIVGGICGKAEYNGTITSCSNSGQVSGDKIVGGICGFDDDWVTMTDCSNSGQVSGNKEVGGICGQASTLRAIMSNCINSGRVSGTENVGGICGEVYYESYYGSGLTSYCYYLKDSVGTKDETGEFVPNKEQKGIGNRSINYQAGTTALPKSQMTAAAGTYNLDNSWVKISGMEEIALVDALNSILLEDHDDSYDSYDSEDSEDSEDTNLSYYWTQNDNVNDGYPTILTNNNDVANNAVAEDID